MESNSVCNHTSDKQNRTTAKRKSDLLITSMITDWIGRHEVLLPINHKNYNFREKKNNQATKKGENLHGNTDKGGVNILRLLAKTQKQARAHAHVITTLNVIGWFKLHLWMWLAIKLSDNKLSNNKLSNNKLSDNNLASQLVENRTYLNQSQARKL